VDALDLPGALEDDLETVNVRSMPAKHQGRRVLTGNRNLSMPS
jgi:hypothetical protein